MTERRVGYTHGATATAVPLSRPPAVASLAPLRRCGSGACGARHGACGARVRPAQRGWKVRALPRLRCQRRSVPSALRVTLLASWSLTAPREPPRRGARRLGRAAAARGARMSQVRPACARHTCRRGGTRSECVRRAAEGTFAPADALRTHARRSTRGSRLMTAPTPRSAAAQRARTRALPGSTPMQAAYELTQPLAAAAAASAPAPACRSDGRPARARACCRPAWQPTPTRTRRRRRTNGARGARARGTQRLWQRHRHSLPRRCALGTRRLSPFPISQSTHSTLARALLADAARFLRARAQRPRRRQRRQRLRGGGRRAARSFLERQRKAAPALVAAAARALPGRRGAAGRTGPRHAQGAPTRPHSFTRARAHPHFLCCRLCPSFTLRHSSFLCVRARVCVCARRLW
jgi:hypothetical protein